MDLKPLLLAVAAATMFTTTVYAVPVTGSMTLTTNVITQPTTVTVDQAIGLNFVNADGRDNGAMPGSVLNYGGTFIAAGTGGTINDIANFNTYTTGTLFTLSNGLSFTLNAPLTIQRMAATASSLATLAVSGAGTFSGGGFDTTNGIFTITTQGPNATFNLTSASGVAATTMPEPASFVLLGGSLVAIGLINRKRKN